MDPCRRHLDRDVPPLPADANPGTSASVDAVACAGAVCAARGTYEFGVNDRPVLWSLTGGTWSATSAPLPADAARVDLGSVQGLACSDGGTCVASGLYLANPGLTSHRVLWRRTVSGWTATAVPPPAGMSYAESLEFGAACGPAVCLTTLDLMITGGRATALWTLDAGAWTRTDLPLPSGAQAGTGHLLATSCSSSGECLAVGRYTDSGGDVHGGLWVRAAAGTWTATRAAVPADAAQNPRTVVRRLSCSDAGACVATGSYVYHRNGSDIDDEASYDRLQWTYADGHWSLRKAVGANRTQERPALTSGGSGFCVRFDGFRTLWTLAGDRWQTFSTGVDLAGLADGGGVAFGANPTENPTAWVYAG